MTIYDDAIANLQNLVPDADRALRIVPVSSVGWRGVTTDLLLHLSVFVDLGGGVPVKAGATQTFLNFVQSQDFTTLPGRLVLVAMVSGSPVVVDLLGSITMQPLNPS